MWLSGCEDGDVPVLEVWNNQRLLGGEACYQLSSATTFRLFRLFFHRIMGCIRPATPGFIVTLVATILLAVVVFCVPYFKTVYFLKATITVEKTSGSITFGTLGYCIEIGPSISCSKPSIGYQLGLLPSSRTPDFHVG